MKKLILIFVCVLAAGTLSGQFQIGLQGGVGLNLISVDKNWPDTEISGTLLNYQAGLYTRYDFAKYYVEFAPAFQRKGSISASDATEEWTSDHCSRVLLPLRVGRHFVSGLRIFVGSGFDFPLIQENEISEGPFAGSFMYFDMNIFLEAGMGFDISDFSLNLVFDYPVWNEISAYHDNIEITIPTLKLGIGYKL